MHWRWFLIFPLAAFLCGEAVHAPPQREPLPRTSSCYGYSSAKERYLLAYAYAWERPAQARAYLDEMEKFLKDCGGDSAAAILRQRATQLSRAQRL